MAAGVGLSYAAGGTHVPAAIGRMNITCPYTGSNTDDMLVMPNRIGGSHEHDYFGAKQVTATTTTTTIRGHGTSCPDPADESGYWSPSLIVDGTTFRPSAMHIYYERSTTAKVTPFPDDFHLIVGNARSTSDDTGTSHIFFGCAGSEAQRSTRLDFDTCQGVKGAGRNTFTIWLEFPNCWDGKRDTFPSLDAVYSTGKDATCPASHPVLLPTLRTAIWYELPADLKLTGARLSSGPMGSAHSDFVNGWSSEAMSRLVDCINTDNRACPS